VEIIEHGFYRVRVCVLAGLAALCAPLVMSAQATAGDIPAPQQMLLSELRPVISSTISSSGNSEIPVEAPMHAFFYSQVKKTPKPSHGSGPTIPRFEIMGSYSRWHPYSSVNGQPLYPLKDGGVVSGTYYTDRSLGWEVEGSYYEQTANDGLRGGAAGPVYRFILPYVVIRAHGLIGADKFLGPVVPATPSGSFYANPPLWATVLTPGVSVDAVVPLTHGHFAVRAQADYQYIHASYGPAYTFSGGQVNVNSYRIVPGLVFRFGHAADGPMRSQKSNRY